MLGRIAVTPVFLESNGQRDANTENWNSALIQQTLQTVQTGAIWWVDLLATKSTVHSLEFVFDITTRQRRGYAIRTDQSTFQ